MSYPPQGPPPYYGQPPTWSGQPALSGNNPHPYQPEQPNPAYPYYVPGTVMVPVPMMPMPTMPMPAMPIPGPNPPMPDGQPTYITNYIYHGETSNQSDKVQVAEVAGEFNWVPTTTTTAGHLSGKAVLGGHEGWDGSPLWVIRAWHSGDLIPGKLSVRHQAASIMYNGKEVPVQNIEVLCSKPDSLRWVPASNGSVPPGAIPGGKTSLGEVLYVGRARHQLSVTPGKIHPSHRCCYIGFGGSEVSHKMYDVLCRIS